MGTNYYANYEKDGQLVHLGKNSLGWEFHFFTAFGCRSWRELRAFLEYNSLAIFSEDLKLVNFEEFSFLIEQSKIKKESLKQPPKNLFFETLGTNAQSEHHWIDLDGWSFSSTEFL